MGKEEQQTEKRNHFTFFRSFQEAIWKIQSELTPRANVSLTPENFLILTP